MYTFGKVSCDCSVGVSIIDPRTWRVCLFVGSDCFVARHTVDDFGNLVRVSEWLW